MVFQQTKKRVSPIRVGTHVEKRGSTPIVDANNFELKPALITMVQQHQFTGHPTKDPNEHLGRFLRMANTVKLNGVRPEVIKLHLFPFSLRDIAATRYES